MASSFFSYKGSMSLILSFKTVPQSSNTRLILDKAGRLIMQVKSAPEKGKANREIIAYLAKIAGVTQADVTILTGYTAPQKRIKINTTLTMEQLLHKLGIETQKTFLS